MRTTRGMSRTTMSHKPMRAASALSALAETRRDELVGEVIEGCRRRAALVRDVELARLVDRGADLPVADPDHQFHQRAPRSRIDAVAGRTRVRGGGCEPGEGARGCAAFRWIYLPVALHRRLPVDIGVLLPLGRLRLPSLVRYRNMASRDGLCGHHVHSHALAVEPHGSNSCGAAARLLSRVHHVFVARNER